MRTLTDALNWQATGTQLLDELITGLTSDDAKGSSGLPQWSRAHVVAHLNGNADALLNLVTWAASGIETPMYGSPSQRDLDIERGSTLSPYDLTVWFAQSVTNLQRAQDQLTSSQWTHDVVTAQGRVVAATEIPWLRAREVFVHAVDLDRGVSFADLPTDFLEALVADIVAKRGLSSDKLVKGPLHEVAAWLAGRPHHLIDAPDLGPWL